jgi:16S rRNA (guanine527-N7)-methyltransferase
MFHVKHDQLIAAYPQAEGLLSGFANWLAGAGLERGLLGPREVDRIWDRHIANCAVVEQLIAPNSTVIDIGSGAGLPGVAIAIVRPDLQMTLVEPLLRRSDFLSEMIADLGLAQQIQVVRSRAEQAQIERADIVTARAVAPLAKLLGWSLPHVAPGGQVLAMKGSTAAQEIEDAAKVLKGRTASIEKCGTGIVDPPTTVVRVTA